MSETLSTTTPNIDLTGRDIEFQHAAPERVGSLSRGANIAIAMGAMASRLVNELRTRTVHPDGRRENVSEHSHMLTKVSISIARELYPWLDISKVATFSSLHDDPEGYVGDTPTDSIANHDPMIKALRELAGLRRLSEEHHDLVPSYVEDMNEYEEQLSYEAQFVRIVDKIMVLLIHIPNEGEVLRRSYTYDEYMESTYAIEQRLLEQYPEWIELIQLRTELAEHIGNTYMRDWNGYVQDRLPLQA